MSRIADSVVALEISRERSFDFSEQGTTTATGFVVDSERGIILTNRHVIGSGPISAVATFQNKERVDAVPLYRDPVHDFGFLRYDPGELEQIAPRPLQLRPDKAATGLDIRVVGSDGGEQLSILAGTIARLDRAVPNYGRYRYNDFNTFYFQAASSTSGGSSGSPVINADGDVVALNAAANSNTASSFFLPLDRIVSALNHLQSGVPISRGTLQTLFYHRPFEYLRRIGLQGEVEENIRASNSAITGLLVVSQVISGGVAEGKLLEGDILISIDDRAVTDFVTLESTLDEAVGSRLNINIERQGSPLSLDVDVADLHALFPTQFVEIGGAVVHDLTLQIARATNKPQKGVVVANRGYMFSRANVPTGAVITEINGTVIDSLDDFIQMVETSADGAEWLVRFYIAGREFTSEFGQVFVDRKWFDSRSCTRLDDADSWPCELLADASESADSEKHGDTISAPSYQDKLTAKVAPALVNIQFDIPHPLDNVYAQHFSGTGLVVGAKNGLVAVDRNTVPITLGDAELTFLESIKIPAHVVFVHPLHNVALLQYDPELIGAAIEIPEVTLAFGSLRDESNMFSMIGFKPNGALLRHTIDRVDTQTLTFDTPRLPRFQQSPIDVFAVFDMPSTLGGVIADDVGAVHSLWSSFAYPKNKKISEGEWALSMEVIQEALDIYSSGKPLRLLGAKLRYVPLAAARQVGLPDDWLQTILQDEKRSLSGRRVLMVGQVYAPPSGGDLQVGDLVLAIDGEPVRDLRDVERRIQTESVTLTLLRRRQVLDVQLTPMQSDLAGTQRIIHWAGAYLQMPHTDILLQRGAPASGVYVGSVNHGSPASRNGLFRNRIITAVDGISIQSLDDFLNAVANKKAGENTRLSLTALNGQRSLVSVKPEYNFWQTFELRNTQSGWDRINHSQP
ncbi:MAG: trypsin-like peptidase domain-containing protein [Pseudomonadota bacterium]